MQENNERDVIEIDLKEVLGLLLAKLGLIVFISLLTGAAGFALSYFVIIPRYDSTTSIYILNKETTGTGITYSDAQLATQLTKDYENLIKGRTVLEKVMLEFGIVDEDYEDFADRIEVSNPTDTRIIMITVRDEDPDVARQLADRIREVAAIHIQSVTDVEAVNLVDYANYPTKQAEPKVVVWTVCGALVGLMICVIAILAKYIADDTIKTPEDIEKYLGLSTLAIIPDYYSETKKSRRRRKGR